MTTEINIIFTYNHKESERHQITTFLKNNHSFIFPNAYIRMYECYTSGLCFADSFTKFLKKRFAVYIDNIEILHGNLIEVIDGKADIVVANIIAEKKPECKPCHITSLTLVFMIR